MVLKLRFELLKVHYTTVGSDSVSEQIAVHIRSDFVTRVSGRKRLKVPSKLINYISCNVAAINISI
jgi:hypothetical protein